jgi:predicted O-linked N-acetylglucosamine transferase (SPINDLY family)
MNAATTTEDEVVALCEAAQISAQKGRLEEAVSHYRSALALDPDCLAALYNQALLLMHVNRPAEALASLDSLLARAGASAAAPVHLARGNALAALGRHDAALVPFEQAVRLNPRDPLGHGNRGNSLLVLGRLEEALASLERALSLDPGQALANYNKGNILFALGRFAEATDSFERTVRANPRFALAWYNRGSALLELRRHEEAAVSFDRALALDDHLPQAHNNRGVALLALKRAPEAAQAFERALDLRPDYVHALDNLGSARLEGGHFEEAARSFAGVLAAVPEHPYAMGNLLYAQLRACDWGDGFQALRARVEESVGRGLAAQAPFAFLSTSDSRHAQLVCARTCVADKFPPVREPLWRGRPYGHDRIRVAYVSADFHEHATAFLMAELFERHNRRRFEWTAISFGADDGTPMRRRLEHAFDHFIDVRSRDDREIARLLVQREIDIAVDLKGYTADCRMGIFAQRPVPLQVSYLGYPGTTAAPYIDYVIADGHVIPREHFADYTEKVIHLPGCYQPNGSGRPRPAASPTRADLSLPRDAFVFCCFNACHKITPEVFAIWMRLLRAVPASVLWLYDDNTAATRNLRTEAARCGIDPSRLIFAPRVELSPHLARYPVADLFLDTVPYNAHTTASDALWAGLPALTCQGASFPGRVGASLLHAVGLPELITASLEDYERLAIALAHDRTHLAALRARLAASLETAPLFDSARHTRSLEAAYSLMWQRMENRLAPMHFAVPAPTEAVRPVATVALAPGDAVINYNRGTALIARGRSAEAIAAFEQAVRLNPGLVPGWYNLGTTQMGLSRHEEAVASFDRVLALDPAMTAAHNNRGAALLVLGRPAEAAAALERALQSRPDHPGALENLGSAQMDLERLEEAMATFRRLLAVSPDRPDTVGRLLDPLVRCCAWSDEYLSLRARVVELAARGLPAQFPFPFLSTSDSPAAQLSCARRCTTDKFPSEPEPLWTGVPYAHKRIRVAYLSADFHTHATAFLTAELFERHDRERFECTAVSFGPDDGSPMRGRLQKAFDAFLDVRDVSDRDVARLLREREIDIAVDLKGYTLGRRLGIFAHRMAPVQVNYLGYPGTLGAPYIDYIVADPEVIPREHFEYYTEKVVHLPGCYQPNGSGRPPVAAAPSRRELGLPEGAFVFCCFNASYKITPEIFGIWMRWLRAVPESVLWLLADNRFATANLRAQSARSGIDPGRLVFAPRAELAEHLARQRAADLFVDTLPYNAHTTASDALWAGVPVLTCRGRTFAGRVGASLLQAAALPELITQNLEEYEALALALAADRGRLSALRARLTCKRDSCALFDVERYARNLEAAYLRMWQRAESRRAPAHLGVPDPSGDG